MSITGVNEIEHVLIRSDMWTGSKSPSKIKTFLIDNTENPSKLEYNTIEYSPSWLKCFDEIITNAIDHKVNNPTKVREITIYFSENGEIIVKNDGPGITTKDMTYKSVSGDEILPTPQAIATRQRTSSTYTMKDKYRVTGGLNGFGMTLTNYLSQYFEISTIDSINDNKLNNDDKLDKNTKLNNKKLIKYTQLFENNCNDVNKPEITDYKGKSFTQIRYLPDYKLFKTNVKTNYNILDRLVYTRILFASFYTGLRIKYNDKYIDGNKENIISLLNDHKGKVFNQLIKGKKFGNNKFYSWDVSVIIDDNSSGFKAISVVNGIVVKEGRHLDYLSELLINYIKPKLETIIKTKSGHGKRVNKSVILNHITILFNGQIPNPGWGGQTKEKLFINKSSVNISNYMFTAAFLNKIWLSIKDPILENLYIKSSKTNKKKKTHIEKDNYKGAKKAGSALSHKCSLFAAEGDSAAGNVRNGIAYLDGEFTYYGYITLGGAPMNSRKQVRELKSGKLLRKDAFNNSKKMSSLVEVIGLDYNKTYETEEDMKSLRYGRIIAATDQDVDGVGNIFGLLLNFIEHFWPNLLKRGFVQRLVTPVVIAQKKTKTKEKISFYMESDFDEWVEEKKLECKKNDKPITDALKPYNITYFKGLGRLETNDIRDIFSEINKSITTISYTSKERDIFEIYYGKDTVGRKNELSNTTLFRKGHTKACMTISSEDQLRTESKLYFLCKIRRNLLHVMDGMNYARRKVVAAGQITPFPKPKKVFTFTGTITDKMSYHHGDMSMNGCITNMGQKFRGKNIIPLLLGKGMFGSFVKGGKDAGSARYIEVSYNNKICDLLFPKIDNAFLKYTPIDGYKAEPDYYIPIIPLVLLQNYCSPGAGWKGELYSRDWKDLVYAIKGKLKNNFTFNQLNTLKAYDPWLNNNNIVESARKTLKRGKKLDPIYLRTKVDLIKLNNVEYSIGDYEYDKTKGKLIITSLPIGYWTDKYKKDIQKKEYVKRVIDDSTEHKIYITISLTNEGKEYFNKVCFSGNKQYNNYVDYWNPIEKYFNIVKPLNKCLNFYNNGGVISFKEYEDIFEYWYPIRLETYKKRVNRLIIITKMKILVEQNIIRYINNYRKLNLIDISEEKANNKLEQNNYDRINTKFITNNDDIPNNLLEDHIRKFDANYNYLNSLTDREKYKGNIIKRNEKLNKLELYLKKLESKEYYKKLWLEELNKLESEIEKGIKNNWESK